MRIVEVRKESPCHNPISGHHWTEYGQVVGYEVCGGLWTRQRHRTLAAAIKDRDIKAGMNRKFPQLKGE